MAGRGSSSHGNVLPALRKTLGEFVSNLPVGVEVRAWRFAKHVDAVDQRTIRTEADRAAFRSAVKDALTAEGGDTHLYSAIAELLDFAKQQKGPTPTLLVFTDGADTEHRLTFKEVVGKAEEAKVAKKDLNLFVYTLGFKSPDMPSTGPVKVTDVPDPTVPFKVTVDAPVAAIDASPRKTYVDTEVLFLRPSEAGGGPIDGYAWDLGDGTPSDQPRPRHRYAKPGSYTVSLTATGPGGKDTHQEKDFIVIEPKPAPAPPKADFDVRPSPPRPHEEAFFRDLSTGLVDHYLWDFGDGATSTERSPSHRYERDGEYRVTLHVEGPGGTADAERQVTVQARVVVARVMVQAPSVAGGDLGVQVGLGREAIDSLACVVKREGGLLSRVRGGAKVRLADDGGKESGDAVAGDGTYAGRWRAPAPGRYRVEVTGKTVAGVPIRGEGNGRVYLGLADGSVRLGRVVPGRALARVTVRSLADGPVTVRVHAAEDGPAAVVPTAGGLSVTPGASTLEIPLIVGTNGLTGPFRLNIPLEVGAIGDAVAATTSVVVEGRVITTLSLWLRRGAWTALVLLVLLTLWAAVAALLRPHVTGWSVEGHDGSSFVTTALRRKAWRPSGLFTPTPRLSIGGRGTDLPVLTETPGPVAYLRPQRGGRMVLEKAARRSLEYQDPASEAWNPVGRRLPISERTELRDMDTKEMFTITQ